MITPVIPDPGALEQVHEGRLQDLGAGGRYHSHGEHQGRYTNIIS